VPSVSHNIFLSEYMWMTLTFRLTGSHNSNVYTTSLPIGVPLEPSLYLQPSSRYKYQMYLDHDLDLSPSRDVIAHVTI